VGSENAHRYSHNAENNFLGLRPHKDGNEFHKHITRVTGVETWVSIVIVEMNGQSKQWKNTHSLNKLQKLKQSSYACQKVNDNCFLGQQGVLKM
jgi:hypothetical protein